MYVHTSICMNMKLRNVHINLVDMKMRFVSTLLKKQHLSVHLCVCTQINICFCSAADWSNLKLLHCKHSTIFCLPNRLQELLSNISAARTCRHLHTQAHKLLHTQVCVRIHVCLHLNSYECINVHIEGFGYYYCCCCMQSIDIRWITTPY